MKDVSAWLIEENCFVRQGMKSLLEKSQYHPSVELGNLQEFYKIGEYKDCDMIIMGADMPPREIASSVAVLKSKLDHAKIVLLSSELDRLALIAAFSAGADAYLLKNISAEAFLASLTLVMMNEKIFPTSMASLFSEYLGDPFLKNGPALATEGHSLSHREIDIIRHIADGESNKAIARNLMITESTVKVHLKTILRKLGLINRTQAAIWALNNGLASHPCMTDQRKPTNIA
jgi:two-component system nitrate/nitrite response regulator NarL